MQLILGIDPGFYGAWCVVEHSSGKVVRVEPTPLVVAGKKPHYDLTELAQIRAWVGLQEAAVRVVLEVPPAMPLQSSVATSRQFTGYGLWLGLFAGYRLELVTPATWKRLLGLSKDKQESVIVAHGLYPEAMVGTQVLSKRQREGVAEALLLAEYGRRLVPGAGSS